MIEKIVDILKEFLEKHFLPSLLSVVFSAIIYYFTPDNFSILTKLGEKFYIFTIFCLSLLVIELAIKLYIKVNNNLYYSREKDKYDKEVEHAFENRLFEISHSLSPEDKKILDYFLENENKPLVLNGAIMGDLILNTYCDSNDFKVEESNIVTMDLFSLKPQGKLKKGTYATQYRLKDEYYESFMYIKKKYGKITKF